MSVQIRFVEVTIFSLMLVQVRSGWIKLGLDITGYFRLSGNDRIGHVNLG